MRIVLDTNVLINGVQDENSYAYRIIKAAISGKVTPVISQKVRRENKLLVRKMVLDQEYKEGLEEYYRRAEVVRTRSHFNEILDDQEDNKLLEAAVDGQAEYIITEDRHLLEISSFKGVEMLRPQEFWERHQEDLSGESSWQDWMKNLMKN